MSYVIDQEKCVGCGVCVPQCDQNAIEQAGDKYQIIKDKCTDCGACADICSAGVISKEEK